MRRTLLSLLCLASLLPIRVSAATLPVSGDLIKGSGSTVYYLGADNKRYTFPTDKTYFSWYADFSGVKTISDSDLSSFPLKGNVTYRPGTRLVKITTDPKVYAVAHSGVLRWVQTETAANAIFGADWAKQIDDIPDAFFINYTIGAPIAGAADFVPATERTTAASINVDKGLTAIVVTPTTPPPTTTSTTPVVPPVTPVSTAKAFLYASDAHPYPGNKILLTARVATSTSALMIQLSFNGTAQRTCNQAPCVVEVTVPNNDFHATYTASADVTLMSGERITLTTPVAVSDPESALDLKLDVPEIRTDYSQTVTLTPLANVYNISGYEIYEDGNLLKSCDTTDNCVYSFTETSASGTTHEIYGVAYDDQGYEVMRSATKTYAVVNQPRPIVAFDYNVTNLIPGETTNLTVNGSGDAISWTELWLGDTLVRHCDASSCAVTIGPWWYAQSLIFTGITRSRAGLEGSATSTAIIVH